MTASFTRAFLTHDLPLDVVHDVDGGLLGRGDHLLRVPAGAVLLLTSQSVSVGLSLLCQKAIEDEKSVLSPSPQLFSPQSPQSNPVPAQINPKGDWG